ncbi:RNI-like protein, partial [Lophiostoma macrostomum CBS 122681]
RILAQGPWCPFTDRLSLAGPPSLPAPVQVAEPETLRPLFEHLHFGGDAELANKANEPYYDVETLGFEKGVIYSDGRLDLCKMALGPPNIKDLLASLKTNPFISHFLLGNNIIGPHGARCIADFLKEYPNRIETWYISGNCIDGASFKTLVNELIHSTSVTGIWLKRNPLGHLAADDVFRLITQTPNLHILDLGQTELGDIGIASLFTHLAAHTSDHPLPLRHLYLDANGISITAATAISTYLSSPHCTLTSLYLSNNPLGSTGITALALGLHHNKTLTRLTLASTGLTDDGAIALCEALSAHPTLMTLDMGQSYATADLDSRYNWLTDRSAEAVRRLIAECKTLRYLDLGLCAMTHAGLTEVLCAVLGEGVLFYGAESVYASASAFSSSYLQSDSASGSASGSAAAMAAAYMYESLCEMADEHLEGNVKRVYGEQMEYERFLEEEKRWLVSDRESVRKINSVYRNRDAVAARRGEGEFEKWWEVEDGTLEGVMD